MRAPEVARRRVGNPPREGRTSKGCSGGSNLILLDALWLSCLSRARDLLELPEGLLRETLLTRLLIRLGQLVVERSLRVQVERRFEVRNCFLGLTHSHISPPQRRDSGITARRKMHGFFEQMNLFTVRGRFQQPF